MKIGVLGGTFDPIHNAHLKMGEVALSVFNLDKVLFMPAGIPYFKSDERTISLNIHRANMTKIAIRPYLDFEFCDLELNREGYTYTIDSINELKKLYKNDELYFIFGADSFMQITSWHKPKEIFKSTNIIVANRNDTIDDEDLNKQIKKLNRKYHANIFRMDFNGENISSTKIRESIYSENDLDYIPKAVKTYIIKNGLYKNNLNTDEIKSRISIELNKNRYIHSLGVADTAYDLALCHGYENPDKAYLAGLLHDVGKPYSDALGHASVGANIAKKYYNIDDVEILTAIKSHTVGSLDMSLLDKIIFIADFIEPNRDKFPELELIRPLAYVDLNRAILKSIECTFDYLGNIGGTIDEKSLDVYNYYKEIVSGELNVRY